MARKKTVTTTEELPETQEFVLPGTDADNPFADFVKRNPNNNRKFKVSKWEATGTIHLFSTNDAFDEDFLQENYGGGRYLVKGFVDGVKTDEWEFKVADKPNQGSGGRASTSGSGSNASEGSESIPRSKTHEEFLETMIITMLGNRGNNITQPTPVGELTEAMKNLQGMGGTNGAREYTEGFKAGVEMARNIAGGGGVEGEDWKSTLFRTVKEIALPVANAISSARGTTLPAQPATESTQVPIPTNENELNKMIFDGIQKLKKQCMKGIPVDLVVDWIVTNADDYQEFVRVAFTTDFSTFCKIDPEIANEPYVTWFKLLYDGLRTRFRENYDTNDDSEGDGGDEGNPNRNEGPRAVS